MRIALGVAAACLSIGLSLASDVEASIKRHTDIPAQGLGPALRSLAKDHGFQIVYASKDVSDLRTSGAVGELTITEALAQILMGTGLTYRYLDDKTITVAPLSVSRETEAPVHGTSGSSSTQSDGGSAHEDKGFWNRLRLAQSAISGTSADAAQEQSKASQSSGEASPSGIQEVVVTATKRQENIRDVPMSIAVIGNQEIEHRGLTELDDYLRTMPAVSYLEQGVGRNTVVIRGISISPQTEGFSSGQTVGTYFGEVPLSGLRMSATDIKLVDIDRVEVLRGPQGTLYGAGSLSGAIRNIPMAPDLQELGGKVDVGYSVTSREGGDNSRVTGVLNIPLAKDTLALRIVGYRFDDSGYVANVAGSDPAFVARAASFGAANLAVNQNEVGDSNYTGGRIQMLWKPTENFSATFMYLAQDLEQDGLPEVQLARGTYQQARLQMGDVVGGGSELLSEDTRVGNVVLEYKFPWATLSSSSSYTTQDFVRNYDIGVFFGNVPIPQHTDQDATAFNQEIRLVSNLSGPMQFIAGLYYEDIKDESGALTYYGGASGLNPFPGTVLFNSDIDTNLKQKALFGEVSYTFAERLTLTGGVRVFDYDRDVRSSLAGALAGAGSATEVRMDERSQSYKLNLAYKPSADALIYALWSQGFRLGKPGAQSAAPPSCDTNGDGFIDGLSGVSARRTPDINSDLLENTEVGGKLGLLDNRLALSAAVYDVRWTDLPITVIPACGFSVVLNAGRAKVRGVEMESALRVSDDLVINVAGSYLRAELDGDTPSIGADGDRLPGSPKYQYNAGVQYSFNAAAIPMFVRADYAFVGGYYNNVKQTGFEAGDYAQLDLRIGAAIRAFDVSVFGENLTDADNLTWVNTSIVQDGRAYRLRPRTVGVQFGYHF